MSRWTNVLPRLILTVILLVVLTLGVDPAVRWALTNGARATSAAQLAVRGVRTNLIDGTAMVDRLEIFDPADPEHQIIEVSDAKFEFSPWALAKGRLVIRDGELRGLRINADQAPSSCAHDSARPQLISEAAALGKAWQQVVTAQPPQSNPLSAQAMIQRVEDQRVVEFQRILQQAAQWQSRFDELDELTRIVGDNPLRMTPAYRARLEQLAAVGQEILDLNESLAALQRQVQQDRMTLEQAKADQVAALRQNTELAPVDGAKLSSYLLEDEWAGRVGSWVNWIRQSRQVADLKPVRSRYVWTNSRGVDVLLNAGRQSDFEVQNLYLEGAGQVDGQAFRFRGTLQNLSDEPGLATEPTVLTLAGEGNGAIQMDAVLDRSSDTALDRIRVVCPALQSPRKTWGDPREFAVEAGPGALRIAMNLEVIDGQELRGRIDFAQTSTTLTPSWPGSRREGDANQTIQQALQEVQEVSGAVELSGTLQHPIWQLQSDLGHQVASRMQDVLCRELAQRTEMLVQQHQTQSDRQLQRLAQVLAQHERAAVDQLAAKSSELERFRNRIAQRTDLMDQLVRDAGPLENLLRR